MRIAVIIDTWFPYIGGGQINAWEIARRVAKGNIFIDIVTRDNGPDDLKPPKNIKIIKLGPRTRLFNTLSKINFLIRSFLYIYTKNYDLVHAHAFLPGITARLLMVFKGVPAVFTVHGTSIGTNLLNPLARYIEKFILTEIRYSAQITVARDFLNLKNINTKISYIANGVDVKKFDKINPKKFNHKTLIFVGRLHPQKNLLTLIQAFKKNLPDHPDVQLKIVGDGPQRQTLLKEIKRLKLAKSISILGEVTGVDLIKLYKSSHIFILPSIYEGQPLTLLEAWASMLPAIATKTGDCQFLVKNGVNGYLINNPQDPSEIANVIAKILESKNLEKMGLNGYNLVKKNFSWDKSARDTLNVYESLAKIPAYRQAGQN